MGGLLLGRACPGCPLFHTITACTRARPHTSASSHAAPRNRLTRTRRLDLARSHRCTSAVIIHPRGDCVARRTRVCADVGVRTFLVFRDVVDPPVQRRAAPAVPGGRLHQEAASGDGAERYGDGLGRWR